MNPARQAPTYWSSALSLALCPGRAEIQHTPVQPLPMPAGTHFTQPRRGQEDTHTWFFFFLTQTELLHCPLKPPLFDPPLRKLPNSKFLSPLILPLCYQRNAPFSILKGPLASPSSPCAARLGVVPEGRAAAERDARAEPLPRNPAPHHPLGALSVLTRQTQPALSLQIFSVYSSRPPTLVLKNFSLLPLFSLPCEGTF